MGSVEYGWFRRDHSPEWEPTAKEVEVRGGATKVRLPPEWDKNEE